LIVTDSFEQFRKELHEKVQMAKRAGMGPEALEQQAEQLGDWLSRHADPKNPEQRLLRELWSVADEDEQHALADVLVKFAERG
jgi:cell shape-determining protein MreC